MKKKQFSRAKFWLAQFGFIGIVVAVAATIILMKYEYNAAPVPEGAPEKRSVETGLENFYREFRQSSSELIKDPVNDFTLEVASDGTPIDTKLKSMSSNYNSVDKRWVGEHKFRSFNAGSTLRTILSDYAAQEGMQVVWDLDEDFVIKHQFQTDSTIVGALADVAKAIDNNFDGTVRGYFCPKQRSLVVTTVESDFIRRECNLAR